MEIPDSFLSLSETRRLLAERQVSPVELVDLFLERIRALDRRLNSYLLVTESDALQQAVELQKRADQDFLSLALAGIPLALKDLYDLKGHPTTAGSRVFDAVPAAADAAAVHALRKAGAVFLGKTNLHEAALGLTNVNPHFGACHNPWDLNRVSGGSSGGSAVAVASGLCLGALGSDTGGSIRVPAALCGVVGLKPTYGRVSMRGAVTLSWNLDHAGPLARTVQDAAMLYQVIAGYDPEDPASADLPVEPTLPLIGDVHSLRIALAQGDYLTQVTDPQVWAAVQQAAQVFTEMGGQLIPVEMSWLREAALANGIMVQCDAAVFHKERLAANSEGFGEDVRKRLEIGAGTPMADYVLSRRTQALMRQRFREFFKDVDLLLLPTTAVPAPPISGPDALDQARLLTRFTAPFNLTGLPAITVPCGFTASNLPIGLQIVAPEWQERRLLDAAHAYQMATGWHTRTPPL